MEIVLEIVICDDDAEFLNKAHESVLKTAKENDIFCSITLLCSDAELIEYFQDRSADIIITDIDMPDKSDLKSNAYEMSGFKAAQKIQREHPETEIIFLTAHEELAYQSFRYRPFSFVSKRDLQMLDEDLKELFEKLINRKTESLSVPLIIDKKIYMIDKNKIMYFKSDRHYINAYTADGKEAAYRCSINEAYKQLSKSFFIFIHRSYLVNCRFIKLFNTQYITLTGGEKIALTRNEEKIREAQIIFSNYKRSLR